MAVEKTTLGLQEELRQVIITVILNTHRSNIFDIIHEVGLLLEGNEGSSCLKIGVMLARFQAAGNTPSVKDKLNNLQRLGAIFLAVSFNILPGMLSGHRLC